MDTSSVTGAKDGARLALQLRAIVVGSRAALRTLSDPRDVAALQNRAAALLDKLERRVLKDGADPRLVAGIREARGELLP